MADLPESRVLPNKPPFTGVGVHYFGPFHVKRGRSLVKGYGVIFTCLAIWAVHIEVAESLDTDWFLLALRHFIARRERFTPTWRRTSPVVSESCVTLFQISIMKKMHNSLLQKHIKWSFNPPYGSHFGGI